MFTRVVALALISAKQSTVDADGDFIRLRVFDGK